MINKRLTTALAIACASLTLFGCSSTNGVMSKVNNGSLEYQNSRLLEPLKIPANKQTQPFIQIYPTVELAAGKTNVINAAGKQYQLPAPQTSE